MRSLTPLNLQPLLQVFVESFIHDNPIPLVYSTTQDTFLQMFSRNSEADALIKYKA